jgi:O-antigen/teichoic acid export membrane protein
MAEAKPLTGRLTRAIALSASAQTVAKVVNLGLNIVVSLALIRYFGPSGYGDYVFVFSFVTLFGLISDLGLTKIAVRDISKDESASRAILGTAIWLRLALAVVAAVAAQVLLALLAMRVQIRLAAGIASLLFVTDALVSVVVLFQVRVAMQYQAVVDLVVQGVDTVLILALIGLHAGLLPLVAAPVASGAVGVIVAVIIAKTRFGLRLTFDAGRIRPLIVESLPVGLNFMVSIVFLKLDSVLLGFFRPSSEVGIYGAAYKPIEYVLLTSVILVYTLFPLLSRFQGSDPARFNLVYRRGTEAILAYALPVPVLLAIVAPAMVKAVYAPAFGPSALPLQILGVAVVFMIFSAWQGYVLLAGGRQRVMLAYNAVGMCVNAVLNVVLIIRFGYLGAAASALVSSAFVAACALVAPARLMGSAPDVRRLPRVLLANVALGLSLALLMYVGAPWWIALAGAGVAYPVWLLLFRVTSRGEIRMFLPQRSGAVATAAMGAG